MKLKDKTIFITGASRGIGREIALRCAIDKANIVIAAKTDVPHDKLPGTIHTVAKEVEDMGGNALAIKLDVRDNESIRDAISKTKEHFGGIDVLVNNASAINLSKTLDTRMKRFDLMFDINVRATFACSKYAIPFLKDSLNPHILTLSPPLNLAPKWFKNHLAYTMSKYGMSMCTLGLSEELKEFNIGVNSLWPKTTIATSAVKVHLPETIYQSSRKPLIVADAAYEIITKDSSKVTGNFFIDEDVLKAKGITDFAQYSLNPDSKLYPDLFV